MKCDYLRNGLMELATTFGSLELGLEIKRYAIEHEDAVRDLFGKAGITGAELVAPVALILAGGTFAIYQTMRNNNALDAVEKMKKEPDKTYREVILDKKDNR